MNGQKRIEELGSICPFLLTANELYELLELYGFTPDDGEVVA
jgi:hypothetical protein